MALQVLSKLRLPSSPVIPTDVARLADISAGGGINYSTLARNTGLKWIESSPVYRVVFMAHTGTGLGTANTVGQLADFIGLVNVSGHVIAEDRWMYPIGYSAGTHYISVRIFEDGTVAETHNPDFFNNVRLILTVDYVTIQTDFTSWDSALTGWDHGVPGGETVWDVSP